MICLRNIQLGSILFLASFAVAQDTVRPPIVFSNVETMRVDRGPLSQSFFSVIQANESVFDLLDNKTSLASTLEIDPSINQPSAWIPEQKKLSVSNFDCLERSSRMSTNDYLAIAIHELGHSLFDANIEVELRKRISDSKKASYEFMKLVFSNKIQEARALTVPLADTLPPFHEFVADVVAVMVLDSPSAIADLLVECKKESRTRDFALDYPIVGWDVGPLGGAFDRRHEVFNPARRIVWLTYQNEFKRDRSKRSLILRSAIDASKAVITEIEKASLTYEQWENISQADLNTSLIKKFNESVARFSSRLAK